MWFTQHGLCPHRNFYSFVIIPSNKKKGYNLQQPRHTSSSVSHSLSHIITKIVLQYYNTMHNRITMLSFYRGATQYHGSANCWPTNIPKISFGGLPAPIPPSRGGWAPLYPCGGTMSPCTP